MACLFIAGSAAPGEETQPLTERERQLLERIEQLEQRLEVLERQLGAPAPAEDLSARVERLEQAQAETAAGGVLTPVWDNGLKFASADESVELEVGGRIFLDLVASTEDDEVRDAIGELDEGVEFRTARMHIGGTIYDRIEFMGEYNFAGGEAGFEDVYIGLLEIPYIGGIRIGHFDEPWSLEQNCSGKYHTLMERASPVKAFSPNLNTGILAHNAVLDRRMTWAVGLFRDTDDFGDRLDEHGNEWNVTGRITGLPVDADDGARLVHLGLSASYRNPNRESFEDPDAPDGTISTPAVRYRTRPACHSQPYLVDTGWIPADSALLLALEAALVYGPASLQAEYLRANVEGTKGYGDPTFDGWYVEAAYFLSGEHRPYKRSWGEFDRVRPRRNALDGGGGLGAWQLALRYSQLDLQDGSIDGGQQDDVTLGLNWHLNPNTRVMWNWVHAMVERDRLDLDGDADIIQMRFQVDF